MFREDNAQVVVGPGKVRLQFQCPAVTDDGVIQFSLILQRIAQVDVENCHVPFQPYRPSNKIDGNLVLPDLVSNHAEKVESVGMIRLDRENLSIDLLGSLQPTGLMVPNRNRQYLGNRCHEENYDNTACQRQCVSTGFGKAIWGLGKIGLTGERDARNELATWLKGSYKVSRFHAYTVERRFPWESVASCHNRVNWSLPCCLRVLPWRPGGSNRWRR